MWGHAEGRVCTPITGQCWRAAFKNYCCQCWSYSSVLHHVWQETEYKREVSKLLEVVTSNWLSVLKLQVLPYICMIRQIVHLLLFTFCYLAKSYTPFWNTMYIGAQLLSVTNYVIKVTAKCISCISSLSTCFTRCMCNGCQSSVMMEEFSILHLNTNMVIY